MNISEMHFQDLNEQVTKLKAENELLIKQIKVIGGALVMGIPRENIAKHDIEKFFEKHQINSSTQTAKGE